MLGGPSNTESRSHAEKKENSIIRCGDRRIIWATCVCCVMQCEYNTLNTDLLSCTLLMCYWFSLVHLVPLISVHLLCHNLKTYFFHISLSPQSFHSHSGLTYGFWPMIQRLDLTRSTCGKLSWLIVNSKLGISYLILSLSYTWLCNCHIQSF